MKDLFNIISEVNRHMREFGFSQELVVGNDNIAITESEVEMKIPFSLSLKIPRDKFEGSNEDVRCAVSQAISQAVKLNK